MSPSIRGQALLEGLLSLSLLVLVVAGAGSLFHSAFQRTRCAYLTFEAAHHRLVSLSEESAPPYAGPSPVRIVPTAAGVEAEGRCGRARERVRLPFLENAQW